MKNPDALRAFASYLPPMPTCFTCSHDCVPIAFYVPSFFHLPYTLSFFTCLPFFMRPTCLPFLRVLHAFFFLRALRALVLELGTKVGTNCLTVGCSLGRINSI